MTSEPVVVATEDPPVQFNVPEVGQEVEYIHTFSFNEVVALVVSAMEGKADGFDLEAKAEEVKGAGSRDRIAQLRFAEREFRALASVISQLGPRETRKHVVTEEDVQRIWNAIGAQSEVPEEPAVETSSPSVETPPAVSNETLAWDEAQFQNAQHRDAEAQAPVLTNDQGEPLQSGHVDRAFLAALPFETLLKIAKDADLEYGEEPTVESLADLLANEEVYFDPSEVTPSVDAETQED